MERILFFTARTRKPTVRFFRNVLGFDAVDAGHGWLIFSLPPSEAAFHPAASNERPELYLMCDDLAETMAELNIKLNVKGVQCGAVHDERWGQITTIPLPGGGTVGLYQPKHPRPAHRG